jgi:hypothetical protein
VQVKDDSEWARLAQIPGLTDPWNDVKDKFNVATDEFKAIMLESHGKKQAEQTEWQAVVETYLADQVCSSCVQYK